MAKKGKTRKARADSGDLAVVSVEAGEAPAAGAGASLRLQTAFDDATGDPSAEKGDAGGDARAKQKGKTKKGKKRKDKKEKSSKRGKKRQEKLGEDAVRTLAKLAGTARKRLAKLAKKLGPVNAKRKALLVELTILQNGIASALGQFGQEGNSPSVTPKSPKKSTPAGVVSADGKGRRS